MKVIPETHPVHYITYLLGVFTASDNITYLVNQEEQSEKILPYFFFFVSHPPIKLQVLDWSQCSLQNQKQIQ